MMSQDRFSPDATVYSLPKVSGFTLVRNGVQFDYPFLESLRSLLPWVDELVINVGVGTDATLDLVRQFCQESGGKARFFESDWKLDDPERRRGGRILAEQTNLALDQCINDWCFYLQADEVFHEHDGPVLRKTLADVIAKNCDIGESESVTAIVFQYVHFYGSFDVVQHTRSAYRREVRMIKKSSGARSVGDAQSFLIEGHAKPKAVLTPARIFHYGWVRTPNAMREKTQFMDSLYHGAQSESAPTPASGDNYRYKKFWGLRPFTGTHPQVMHDRIAKIGWHWDLAGSPLVWQWKDVFKVILDLLERATGNRWFEFKNYRL